MRKEEIQQKIRKDFKKQAENEENYPEWTDEELLATAKVIAKKLGITDPFYSGENDK